MAEIDGYNFPEEGIFYDLDNQLWVRLDDDHSVTCGMTDPAQKMAGHILFVRPIQIGSDISKGGPIATLESSKYAGPILAPLSGKLIEVNLKVMENAGVINDDCYGEGWVLRIKPSNLEVERNTLQESEKAMKAIREKMASGY